MVFTSRLFFACKPGHHAFSMFPIGKDLPLLEENSDLSILSVRDSSSGVRHEIEQAPVATGFQAHLFESKLDTLTNSKLKMSDSLARLARPHGALLDSEEEDALREERGQSEFDPTERILTRTCSRTRRTVDRRSIEVSPSV